MEADATQRIVIVGAGGHAQVVADILECRRTRGAPVQVIGFLDDNPALAGRTWHQLKVLGNTETIVDMGSQAIVAIGNNRSRKRLFDRLKAQGLSFVRAVHPAATLASDVEIGSGTMIGPGAIINTGSRIGQNSILNTGSSVDHHNTIGDHVHVAPGVRLGGDVTVDQGALIGIGAVVTPGRHIGAWSVVAAGAVVVDDVPPGTRVMGTPARPR